jgi:hypothetical protein
MFKFNSICYIMMLLWNGKTTKIRRKWWVWLKATRKKIIMPSTLKNQTVTLFRNKTKAFIIECPFIIVYKLDRYNKICYFKMIIGNVRTTKIIIFLISLAQGNKAENENALNSKNLILILTLHNIRKQWRYWFKKLKAGRLGKLKCI